MSTQATVQPFKMMTVAELYAAADQEKSVNDNIQRRFEKYHVENPKVYEVLVKRARELKATGRFDHYGIGSLWEIVRWHFNVKVDRGGERFKLCDNFRSRYARLIMQREPDLKGFFKTRPLAVERR